MQFFSTFEATAFIEMAISTLEKKGIKKESIFAVPLDNRAEEPKIFDNLHRSDGTSLIDIGMALATAFSVIGASIGFKLAWGPIYWGLIGAFGGFVLSVSEALSYAEDAIGIGRKGTIDKPYLLRAPFWTVDTLFYAVPKEKYHLDFVHSIFQRVNWKQNDESTGVPSLSKTTINAVNVSVPGYEEQEKIGTFFKQIDHLITLHQRKPWSGR